jgi:hypothetical protein
MTNARDNKFWNEMADHMRRALHLNPLTNEEAERAYDESPDVPMTEEQIAEFVKTACSSVPHEPSYKERISGTINQQIDQEVEESIGLYRNEGEIDPEVEEEMRRQREEALEEDDQEEEDGQNPKKS